jgi:hypothetical protein
MQSSSEEYDKSSFKRRTHVEKKRIRKLPPNMIKLDTHRLLKTTIDLNNLQNKILNTPEYNDILNNIISNINAIFETAKQSNAETEYNYFIAGARSWNRFFKDFYDLDILSPYEKSSMHNTNADLYYFINNKALIDESIKENIKLLLKSKITPLVNAIKKYVDLEDNTKNVYITLEEDTCLIDKKSLITSKRLYLKLHISDSVPKKKQTRKPIQSSQQQHQLHTPVAKTLTAAEKKAAKMEAERLAALEEEKKRKSQISDRKSRAARRNKPLLMNGGGVIEQFSKVILSIDLYYSTTSSFQQDNLLVKNIGNLIEKDEINGFNYLNLFGLYIFLQLGIKKIYVAKGYNIFKIREIIFDKLILFGDYKTPTLKKIIEEYYATFNGTILFDNYFYTDLQKIYALSHESIATVINTMEITIIETLRRYINRTIININKEISELNSDIGLFVVGGDALRRYKNDISVTKDIDCKIYVPKILLTSNLINGINTIIISELIKLVCYLIENTDIIFSDIQSEFDEDLYKIKYELSNSDPDITNFRYRQTFKDPFPVDLYSLDYRCKINVEVKDNANPDMNTKFYYNYDIAFLDVVLEILNSIDIFYNDNAILSHEIPISKLEFLLRDLKNTYNSDTSSLLRFIGGKITKDYDRYNALLELIKQKKFIYSTEPLIIEKKESPDDSNLYVCEYRKAEKDEEAADIKIPVLFEKNQDEEAIYARYELDIIYDYSDPSSDFHTFYSNIYKKIPMFKRKKMFSYNLNEIRQFAGGTKLDRILSDSKKEIEDLEISDKSLCEKYNQYEDDISRDIIDDIGDKRILYNNDIKQINQDNYINNYVLDIMSPHNTKLSSNDKLRQDLFYSKISNIIKSKKTKKRS